MVKLDNGYCSEELPLTSFFFQYFKCCNIIWGFIGAWIENKKPWNNLLPWRNWILTWFCFNWSRNVEMVSSQIRWKNSSRFKISSNKSNFNNFTHRIPYPYNVQIYRLFLLYYYLSTRKKIPVKFWKLIFSNQQEFRNSWVKKMMKNNSKSLHF